MFKRRKYTFNKLKEKGISESIIEDLYKEKITEQEIDIIANSNHPYDICRLLVTKEFRNLNRNKKQIIDIINESEKNYQAYYGSMAAINKDVLKSDKILSIVYNITRAKKVENAKLAYEVSIDKTILDTKYPSIATAMASNGATIEKIYALIEDNPKKEKTKVKSLNNN